MFMDFYIGVCVSVIIVKENEAINLRWKEVKHIGGMGVRKHGGDWKKEKKGE